MFGFKDWKNLVERAEERADMYLSEVDHQAETITRQGVTIAGLRGERDAINKTLVEARKRLADVAACETPSANATVRRMARIARGGGK